MANQRPKAIFFVFLLLSAHAFRVQDLREEDSRAGASLNVTQPSAGYAVAAGVSQAEASARGALQAGYWVVQNSVPPSSWSPATTTIISGTGFSGTQVLSTSTGLTTSSTLTAITNVCTGGGGGPKYPVGGGAGPSAGLPVRVVVLIAAGILLMGALYFYHQHRMNGRIEASFCPVSSWESDPVGIFVGPAASGAFGGDVAPFLSEDNSRGMPKCHGLRRHRLQADCDGDVDCKRQACRQMCCARRDCTFFQFNSIDSTDNCWLGSRSQLGTSTCEQPFFGETCTTCRDRRSELWPQILEDNMKCHSATFGFTGFHVENQYECQAHAVAQAHEYYQYDAARRKCESEATCKSPSSHTIHNWQIFSSVDMTEKPHVTLREIITEEESAAMEEPQWAMTREVAAMEAHDPEVWQFEPFLFHESQGMATVQLTSAERCNAGDVTCMRDACRAQCLRHDWCIHYQFENGGDACKLGATDTIDEDDVEMWFGGMLTDNRLCAAEEYKCPSSHNCVKACGGDCEGHSRDGPEGWCVRSALEIIVGSWAGTCDEDPIDAWCRGTERTVVTVSQGLASGQSGADICRAACSADPMCALWQMYPRDANRTDYSPGDRVRCWLGMEDRLGRPRFTCTGRSPKRWRFLSSPQAERVQTRGCQEGKVACVFTQRCVDLCRVECPGFGVTNAEDGICEQPPNSLPVWVGESPPAETLLETECPGCAVVDDDDLWTMSINIRRLINPEDGDTAICDAIPGAECDLVDSACVCEYDDDIDCGILFGRSDRVIPVLADEGMMLFSHDGCSCEGTRCTLILLSSVPPVRTGDDTTSAVQLRVRSSETCDETMTCPNMHRCEAIVYGSSGCGYGCDSDEGHFWCSNECACNKAEAVTECSAGVTCPNMNSCNPISYAEFGCGYSCMRGSTYFFCNDACTVCNE